MRTRYRLLVGAALGVAVVALLPPAAPRGANVRFYSDDPLTREPETQDASGVQPWDIHLVWDLLENLFSQPGDPTPDVKARNVNTIDEVPDSNWFTNRIGAKPLSIDEVVKGPLTGSGPAPGKWTVTRGKQAGVAPGFTMRDAEGETWFVSFDAKGFPDAATGAILVANRIFWALGYWQVENHLVHVQPEQLGIADDATITPPSGTKRRMRFGDLEDVFRRSHRSPDGSYRAVAARARARPRARRLPLLRHASRRSQRRRAARAPPRAARAEGVRRVDESRRHESRQHARHADRRERQGRRAPLSAGRGIDVRHRRARAA